jgi:cytochrome c
MMNTTHVGAWSTAVALALGGMLACPQAQSQSRVLPPVQTQVKVQVQDQLPPINAEAAKSLARRNNCLKCHAEVKDKKGTSYRKMALKYKDMPDGEDILVKNMTVPMKVKYGNGVEEDHRIIKVDQNKPAQVAGIKNMARWILSK